MGEYSGQSVARVMHDATVFTLLCAEGPLTRTEIAKRTGMTKITVLEVTERLTAVELIRTVGKQQSSSPGPRAMLYGPRPDLAFGVVVQIKADRVYVDIEDIAGAALASHVTPQADHEVDASTLVQAIEAACQRAGRTPSDATATVIATSGGVDPDSGRPLAWDLPHWQRSLREDLTAVLGGQIDLENEVDLRAIAERSHGACTDCDDFVYLALGTGIGAGLILGGQTRRGRNGLAGELGYLPLAPMTGGSGSTQPANLHQLLGGEAIHSLAVEHGLSITEPIAAIRLASDTADSAPASADFLSEFSSRVALAAGVLATVLDVDRIILGGDVGAIGGSRLASEVSRRVANLYAPMRVRPTTIAATEVDGDAIKAGALALIHHRLRRNVLVGAGYSIEEERTAVLTNSILSAR